MKKPVAALLLFLLLAGPGIAHGFAMDLFRKERVSEVFYERVQQMDIFMENYYLEPQPAKIGGFLHAADKTGLLDKHPSVKAPFAGFMGALIANNPDRMTEWLGPQYGEKTTEMLQYAAWLAGRSRQPGLERLYAKKPDYFSKDPGSLAERAARNEDDAAVLWGAFLASGNPAYANPAIEACARQGEGAFCTPLRYFAAQHTLVLRRLKDAMSAEKDEARASNLSKGLPPPNPRLENMDGDFGAQLIVTDFDAVARVLGKPDASILTLPHKSWATMGERAVFLLAFTGMTLAEDLSAGLEFDLRVTGPDGKTVPRTEILNKKVVPSKFRTGFGVHYHAGVSGLYFGKGEQPGFYIITAELRDTLSGKKISLTEKINFLKQN